ncbi:MAG: hypothetical protein EOO47_05030 [Flavobacterium sp.]|nr:MAG: hypothetical protein EOO47_05030 [Flavobacterium sp.]
MVKQLTLNQYRKILTDFFKNHLQINTVLFGNKFDFNANENILYPVANIQFLDSSTNNVNIIDRFEITIADLQNDEDDDAEFEIINDCTQIGYDLINYLNKEEFSFLFQVSNVTTINNFSEQNTDVTAGVNFAINLTQQRIINPCNVPVTDVATVPPVSFPHTLPFILL